MSRETMTAALAAFRTNPSMEGVAVDAVEREYVFFGKMDDPDDLLKARHYEDQEQWRILIPCSNISREIAVRIRKCVSYTVRSDGSVDVKEPVYYLTIKSFVKGAPGNVEAESELPSVEGEQMLKIFRAEGDGMHKRRYFFPLEASDSKRLGFDKETFDETTAVWEVDAFFIGDSSDPRQKGKNAAMFHPYVKLDLEVRAFDLKFTKDGKETVAFEIPFPIGLNDVVYSQPHERSAKDDQRVKKIMSEYVKTNK